MAKATKKQALGRGLSALLKDPSNDISSVQDKNADKVIGNIVELDMDTIVFKPFHLTSELPMIKNRLKWLWLKTFNARI